MDDKDILEKIVAEEGNCSPWANGEVCAMCPMSRLKKKDDGSYYSCLEALKAHDLPSGEQDKIYKEAAKRLLLDINIEDLLRS